MHDMRTPAVLDKKVIVPAVISGLLLTGAFPKIGIEWIAWFAMVPLLYAVKDLSLRESFRIGFIVGLVHYLTLLYWLVPVMRTYGFLPWYLAISILFLFAAVLALFMAIFIMALIGFNPKPWQCLVIIPLLWVALEYIRSFLFSGFPWELLGYSQFNRLQLIQISDIFGVYGVSALLMLSNASIFLLSLFFSKTKWQGQKITFRLVALSIALIAIGVSLTLIYGNRRIKSFDQIAAASPRARIAIVQGNIEQSLKWDPAFQLETIKKYIRMSLTVKAAQPELIVWPESATPFYFLYDKEPTKMVFEGIREVGSDFLFGSPSFTRNDNTLQYYVSAYLVAPKAKTISRYDKAHLVPFGEYVPLKKWLPFLGKIVAQVGDFIPGPKGKTIRWKNHDLGVQICYEIIFADLSRAMVKNNAVLLINITNDAWFGKTSGPYQHFSMTVFRAIENRRALVRSANTGISGFIDPAGRVLEQTPLLKDAVIKRTLPLLSIKTIYTRFGDFFAQFCLGASLLLMLIQIGKRQINKGGK
jgi:apolipoprotein N-acyltransferase